jgi:isocitrate dehydrogenase
MRVVAGNSIANMTAVTPGGAGVTQAFNVVSLKGITSTSNATAYSVAQQLVVTSWSILFAIVLLVRAFGWTGGKTLVTQSYTEARQKTSEKSAERKARRHAKRHGEAPTGTEAEPATGA